MLRTLTAEHLELCAEYLARKTPRNADRAMYDIPSLFHRPTVSIWLSDCIDTI